MGIDEVTFHKRTPLPSDKSKLDHLMKRGAKLAVDPEVQGEFERLGGAALDVFAEEPQVPAALLDMPQLVLLPHIGSGTRETRQQMEGLVFENLASFISRGELVTPVL
jgi:hypothetical protein